MYELFVYIGEENRLNGNYLKVTYMESIPWVGMCAGEGFEVTAVYSIFGIIDVVCDRKVEK